MAEIQKNYFDISVGRITEAANGEAKVREDKPAAEPNPNALVATLPDEFRKIRETKNE